MIRKIQSYLGVKLFLLLTAVVVMSVVPLTYIALQAVGSYGRELADNNEQQIRSRVLRYLGGITRERAMRYQAFFDRFAACAGLLAGQGSAIYAQLERFAAYPLHDVHYTRRPGNGHWTSDAAEPVVSVFWGGPNLNDNVTRELSALTHMAPLLRKTVEENPEALAAYVISTSGVGTYGSLDRACRDGAVNLPPTDLFDLRDGEPVAVFSRSPGAIRTVQWTGVYQDSVIDSLMLTASAPIYDSTDRLRGISGIDVPLTTIVKDVLRVNDDENADPLLFSFLLDEDGRIIALPAEFFPFFGLAFNPSMLQNASDRLELSLNDSDDVQIRAFAETLGQQREVLFEYSRNGVTHFLATSRLPGLAWVFGVVVREDDALAFVQKSQQALAQTVRRMEVKGGGLALGILIIAIGVVFVAVRYLVTPLRTLALATRRVAEGDLTVRCPVSTTDEAGMVAASFNTMVEQLRIAQRQQVQYAEELERTVAARTQELIGKRAELEETVDLLKKEAERRQIVDEALRLSRQQYFDTLEASKAGIFIITDHLLTHVNTAFAELFRRDREQLIGSAPLSLVIDEDQATAVRYIEKLLTDSEGSPICVRCRRGDDSLFFGEVWAKRMFWRTKAVLVGTIVDVSELRKNEERLRQQDRQLQKSLEEKEILLREIYHRTKNNMLVIISMLNLQMMEVADERVRTVFREMEDRIRAMALVHEKLYQSQDLSEIDMGSYVEEISRSLVDTMAGDGRVGLSVDIEPMLLNIDAAVPLGLVVNEIVTNSLKHAFPDGRRGVISIALRQADDGVGTLVIEDDGIGLPDDIDVISGGSFGMQVIGSLVMGQLNGTISVGRENGTRFQIAFSEPSSGKRL